MDQTEEGPCEPTGQQCQNGAFGLDTDPESCNSADEHHSVNAEVHDTRSLRHYFAKSGEQDGRPGGDGAHHRENQHCVIH